MKNISRIIFLVMMTLTFVFSTMLQFHHHDLSGNIYLYVTGIGEVELSDHHHDDCADNERHTETDCAMHLDETIVNDDSNIITVKSIDYNPAQAILPEITLLNHQQDKLDNSKSDNIFHFVIEATGFLETISHRGPPAIA